MERSMGSTGNGVRVWFWANGKEPSDLASGSQAVDPSSWGTPGADFDVADNCHGDFGPHKVSHRRARCAQMPSELTVRPPRLSLTSPSAVTGRPTPCVT